MSKSTVGATHEICARTQERRRLERLLASKEPEFLAIYGRRRVGKTFLVRSFFAPRTIWFELTGRIHGTLSSHLQLFAESLSETFQHSAPLKPPESWHEAFRMLREAIRKRRRSSKKITLFFDELPWLATRRSECLEELEHFWNRYLSQMPNVILIVCGSAASWMLQKVIHARGGLHRRLTQTMRLSPFTLSEAGTYLEQRGMRLTPDEVMELYMTFGGVPHYLRLIERRDSVAQNIDRLCFHRASALRNELDEVFASLFDNADSHKRIVEVLAKKRGGLTIKELLAKAKLTSGGGSSRILTALEEAGFISVYVPFGRRSRDRVLRVSDPFSLFALRWMRSSRKHNWAQLRGTSAWRAWAGLAFESVCLDHVEAIERALGISGVYTEASPWRLHDSSGANAAQIDLLIDRADNVISVCEMKYTEAAFTIDKSYAEALKRKLAVFRAQSKTRKALRLVMVSARGLLPNKWSNALVDATVTLDDLFA